MDIKEFFEYPLPKINKDISKIFIETFKGYEGSLTIKNDGDGILEGRIMSNSQFLVFNPEYFTGNNIEIKYNIDLDIYNVDNTLNIEAFIMSNGGEHIIEFFIKVISHCITTEEGQKITTIKDFFTFSKKYPISARKLFKNPDFLTWLYAINYEYMDIYEHFSNDPNKERGLSNFFIFNKLKHRPSLSIISESVKVQLNPYIDEKHEGIISIKRVGQGFIDEKLYTKNNSKWFKLEKEYLTAADFKNEDIINIGYTIDKSHIKKKVESEIILLKNGSGSKNITVSILNFIRVNLESQYIDLKGKGNLIINNYSKEDIFIEIKPKDNFLRFENVIYKIGTYEKIPFNIKLSPLQMAQRSIKKNPVYDTEIHIRSFFKQEIFEKKLKLVVGNFI